MDVVFGLSADGGASPDHGGSPGGSLGAPVVGPAGLVDILETALGLGGPGASRVVRIASFQSALEAIDGSWFWSRSLRMDPWATARTLLEWRDELTGLGWKSDVAWSEPRLAQLAHASLAARSVPPGLADRIVAVVDALGRARSAPVDRIRLMDALQVHPSPLRRLMVSLREVGCEVDEIEIRPAAPATTSLGKLQRWILGSTEEVGGADGTVTLATSSSEPLAAEIVGQWFAGQTVPSVTIVAQDGDTDILDHGLAGSGQPRAGRSRASVHRGSLQLLLLAFKVSWTPFDPRALMEILGFPASPVAPRAARHLAGALEEAPGRGGPEWIRAWDTIRKEEEARAAGNPGERAKVAPRIRRWRSWAEPATADPVEGMPLASALTICDEVTTWATRRYAATNDLLYATTSTLSGEVRAALATLGRDLLPRLLVERVIDQALDQGQSNPGSVAEAARWRSVLHPGAVWAATNAVVWWNFGTTSEGAVHSPWSDRERAELAGAGCSADDVTLPARAASAAWERAILNAREMVLFVAGGLDCEDDDRVHPLAHRIKPALDKIGTRVRLEAALSSPEIVVAGRRIVRQAVPPRRLPSPTYTWQTPTGFAAKLAGMTESATSLESLFSCQLMWALRHVARLRPGRVRSIPDANKLLGNIAHAVAREIFVPGDPPAAEVAASMTVELLEALIDQLAAPLRHPEFAEELNSARRRLPKAMASLADCLAKNGLRVEATERQVSGTFETLLSLRGAVDLVARDRNGHAVIVDLKWTRSEKTRIEELKAGHAVQLATYGALVSGSEPYRAGYFLLNQLQFATLADNGLVGRAVETERDFPDTWGAIVSDWKTWRDTAAGGAILATGVAGVADSLPVDLGLVREVRCDYCDYATLCRVKMA